MLQFRTLRLDCFGKQLVSVELLDDVQTDAVNRYSGLRLPVAHTLFLEFNGTPTCVGEKAQTVASVAQHETRV